MNEKLYSQKKYKDLVKKIKRKIRMYPNDEIINACINYLYSPTKDNIEQLSKQPWLVLLLMKWALSEQYRIITPKKILTNERFNNLLKLVHDLGELVRMPSQYSHYFLFFRNMAYQQFLYQHDLSLGHFARQTVLFSKLPKNHSFNEVFADKVNVDISSFLEISLCLLTKFIDRKESNVSESWFSPLYKEFGRDTISNVLSSISTDKKKLGRILRGYNKTKGNYNEFYEQTPFLKTPFIKNNDKYYCVYPNVLYRTLEHFIYDTLRGWNASKFMNKFGLIFEDYIKRGLSYAELDFFDQDFLCGKIEDDSKVIDFVIKEKNANIFIDAKAVEMSYLGKVTHLADVIKDRTRDSAIKAIEQAISVNHKLCNKSILPEIPFKNENYLLVVTFKELYLGNGQYFYEAIANKKIDEIYNRYPKKSHIPCSNMYFITIEEFDTLMALIKNDIVTFEEVLRKAVENDSDAKTHKFDFTLHLRSWHEKTLLPDFLYKESQNMFKKLENILTKTDNS